MNQDRLRSTAPAAQESGRAAAPVVVFAEPVDRLACPASPATLRAYDCAREIQSDNSQLCEAMSSSCGDSEGRAGNGARPSQLPGSGCPELLHELSNLITGVLLNAQVMEWKLPPYSHLKRPVREVARNAQRGSELMKQLLRRCSEAAGGGQCASRSPAKSRVQMPDNEIAAMTAHQHSGAAMLPGPDGDLTVACDLRTSDAFPKRDDRDGR